jgi:hypothetical protein
MPTWSSHDGPRNLENLALRAMIGVIKAEQRVAGRVGFRHQVAGRKPKRAAATDPGETGRRHIRR